MISRNHRFHGYNSLRHVYQKGRSVRGAMVGLKSIPNSRRSTYRAAVVVSRKVHKSAVVRNRIRRRVYEAIRQREAEIHEPVDMVFTVYDSRLAEVPTAMLHEAVEQLMVRAGVIPQPKGTPHKAR